MSLRRRRAHVKGVLPSSHYDDDDDDDHFIYRNLTVSNRYRPTRRLLLRDLNLLLLN